MMKKVFFMDCGQDLMSLTIEVEDDRKVACIQRVRLESLTPIYQSRWVAVDSMVVGELLVVYNAEAKCKESIKYPIEKIVDLADPVPVICFSLKQVENVVAFFYVDDSEKPAEYLEEQDYPVVIYDKYKSGQWHWDREIAYNYLLHGRYISFEDYVKRFNKK